MYFKAILIGSPLLSPFVVKMGLGVQQQWLDSTENLAHNTT